MCGLQKRKKPRRFLFEVYLLKHGSRFDKSPGYCQIPVYLCSNNEGYNITSGRLLIIYMNFILGERSAQSNIRVLNSK